MPQSEFFEVLVMSNGNILEIQYGGYKTRHRKVPPDEYSTSNDQIHYFELDICGQTQPTK